MSRVSTLQQSQVMLQYMMDNSAKVVDAQRQVDTGHYAEFYQDIFQDVNSLTGAQSLLSTLEQHKQNDGLTQSTLAAYDQALSGMEQAGTDIKEAVMGAINTSSALGFDSAIEGAFEASLSFLNSQTSAGYLFSGSNTDAAPVNITDFSDLLVALEPPTDIFDNNSLKKSVRVDENRTLEIGILADDVGLEIMTALQRIALWENGTIPATNPIPTGPAGPASTPLTPEDQAFLLGEVANLENLINDISEIRGENGLNQKTVISTIESLNLQIDQTEVFISDIQDVDSAEAISNLNQRNFALEASYNVLSQVNRVSLLNFL